MTGADPGRELIAAVRQMLRQACKVTVRVRSAIPMMDEVWPGLSDDVRWTGAADFRSDRARLMLDDGELRFEGPRSYMLMRDGRWQLNEGAAGSWALFHPRYPLEAIQQARERVVVLGADRLRVELDGEKLSALSDAGVSPEWRPLAEVALSGGIARTIRLELTHRTEPQASMVMVFDYEPVDEVAAIELPPMGDTITAADWVREQDGT